MSFLEPHKGESGKAGTEITFKFYDYRLETVFYEIQDTKSKRATGLGYGRRFDGMVNTGPMNSPSPNKYNIES